MFSFTIQMEDGRAVPLLQYVVSLAITEAIKDVCYKNVSCLFVYWRCQCFNLRFLLLIIGISRAILCASENK